MNAGKHMALRWSAERLRCQAINIVLPWSTSSRTYQLKQHFSGKAA